LATKPPSQAVELPSALSICWRVLMAGLFFSWPIVDFIWFPVITPGNMPENWLFVAVSLSWLLSCYVFFDAVFATVRSRWPAMTTIRKILIGWFFGWLPLLVVFGRLGSLIGLPYKVDLFITIPGTILWLASSYVIYDVLFAMAEARWPVAKSIRKVIRSFFKMFLSSHSHHAP
jgi:hypothetical protein